MKSHSVCLSCDWLISFTIRSSQFIPIVVGVKIFFLFDWIIFHCVYIPHFANIPIHLWILGLLLSLIIVNNVAMGIKISTYGSAFNSSEYTLRIGILGLYGNSIFELLWNHHTIFHSSCTILSFHQQCAQASISPCFCQHLLYSDFLVLLILLLTGWSLINPN